MILKKVFLIYLLLSSLSSFSQDKRKGKFGKITSKDFEKTRFELDTSAHAVILADVGVSDFEMPKDEFGINFQRTCRIKIIDKNGFNAATVEIPIYKGSAAEEKLLNVKASAYNLENGQVVETKMDSKDIFTDQPDKNRIIKRFTLPAVKEGTIIEYSYTVSSTYVFNLQPWEFQHSYPCLWSEYFATVPDIFEFIFLRQGYQRLEINDEKKYDSKFFSLRRDPNGAANRTEHLSFTATTTTHHWAAKNVPALKEEAFTTTIGNHITKIEFQLANVRYPDYPVEEILGTWPKLYEKLMKSEEFGFSLDKNNAYLGDVVDGITANLTSDTAKARRIYNYVRQNYKCTARAGIELTKPLKTVFSSHSGNEADLNLLLVAMLRRAKLDAHPVILGTRNYGTTIEKYPLINRFNYTIASVNTSTGTYFMDASLSYLGFGRLDGNCYNGYGRIISPEIPSVNFNADSLIEKKSTYVALTTEKDVFKGHFDQILTYAESCLLRENVKKKGKAEYFKSIAKGFSIKTTLSNTEIEDLNEYEVPVRVSYDFELKPEADGMLYINPMFTEATTSNPFKSEERLYPVEMPYVVDEVYTMNMSIPDGFEVEELPKSAIVKLNENEGIFQYMVQQDFNRIQLRLKLQLTKATFPAEDYNTLRDFFDMVVKKEAEQIVLKPIKQ
jgi:transglutaminase-like putative cysteine protease